MGTKVQKNPQNSTIFRPIIIYQNTFSSQSTINQIITQSTFVSRNIDLFTEIQLDSPQCNRLAKEKWRATVTAARHLKQQEQSY